MLKEFKEFIAKGNVLDLAIGIIIGAAFSKIVDSVVNDLFMPILGSFVSLNFQDYYIPLSTDIDWSLPIAEAKKIGPVIAVGNFVSTSLNFLILSFIIFLMLRFITKLKRKFEVKKEPNGDESGVEMPSEDIQLLKEIRDLLKEKK